MKYCMVNVFVGTQMEFEGISLFFHVTRDYHVRTPHRRYLGLSKIERYSIEIRLLLKLNVIYRHPITINMCVYEYVSRLRFAYIYLCCIN